MTMTRVTMMLALLASAMPLAAHEVRAIGPAGQYTLVVGFRIEPAFEDLINAADITVTRTADQKPISVSAGDVVALKVDVQLRAAEAFDAEIVQAATLAQPAPVFGAPNRYNSWFRPAVDGTYAFRIRGTISDASDPKAGPVVLDETFVCGKGSQSETGSFGCITDAQVFPQGRRDRRGRNRHGYRDDDNLAPFQAPQP